MNKEDNTFVLQKIGDNHRSEGFQYGNFSEKIWYQQNSTKEAQPQCQRKNKQKKQLMSFQQKFKFKSLYIQFRSKWTRISLQIAGRSDIFLKNIFQNNLRKLSNNMNKTQKKHNIFQKTMINSLTLQKIIDLSIVTKQYVMRVDKYPCVHHFLLHEVSDQLLDMCLVDKVLSPDDFFTLIKTVRKLNFEYKFVKFDRNKNYSDGQLSALIEQMIRATNHQIRNTCVKSENQLNCQECVQTQAIIDVASLLDFEDCIDMTQKTCRNSGQQYLIKQSYQILEIEDSELQFGIL